ncbi:MAG: hypothetical protein Kow0075_16030 [Salibacteraceae bacterium]
MWDKLISHTVNLSRIFRKTTAREREIRSYLRHNWGINASELTIYMQALRHRSVVGTGLFEHTDCNERLELLGDAILDAVVTEFLYKQFPQATEGELTKIRSRIVSRDSLGVVGMRSGLYKMVEMKIGPDDNREKIVGNAVEAWLGAIFLDKGFAMVKTSIENFLINQYIDLDEVVNKPSDYKSMLLEWAQQNRQRVNYTTHTCQGDPSAFVCLITINGTLSAKAQERSKKRAEQAAARQACKTIGL